MSNEPPVPVRIDVISDVVCPWCAIGYYQLAKAARQTGIAIDVHWHPFELNPQMAEEGENLREHLANKYGTTPEASRQARIRLTQTGRALGFVFDYSDDMRMWNTFRAHQLIEWAEDKGEAHKAKLALYAAFFTRRQNLNDIKVLANIALEIGLPSQDAFAVLESGEKAESVRQKERFWKSRGINGVPAMIFAGRHLVSGAQGEESYARILRHLTSDKAAQA